METLVATKNFLIFNHENKSAYLTNTTPAHLQQNLSIELVEMIFIQVTLPWVQNFIVFRLQDTLSKTVDASFRFVVTTMPEQVWKRFKDHICSQIKPIHSFTKFSFQDHGNRCYSYKEGIGFNAIEDKKKFKFPSLVTDDWYFIRWLEGVTLKRAELTYVNFVYNQFNQRLRVDLSYVCTKLDKHANGTSFWQAIA